MATKTKQNSVIALTPKELVKYSLAERSVFYAQYNVLDLEGGDVSLRTSISGVVTAGNAQYKLNGEVHEIPEGGTATIGVNRDLHGKRIKIVRSVSGEEGTPCMFTITFAGGYKDAEYHVSSKIDNIGVTAFVAFIDFI
ncbi:hypothetical protein J3D55_000897 [Chryseobacterium ginsenosidimutans]|uniref:hypothetical protein n=1 Tax=Chryseobacterium ginsenosidimutans TaxID=687846 RepID=UPI00216A8312|nr:hypothetical protein [Chryseobacterium ginsenosidimutans]MCS3867981.1 hypothetical protein [Chryseobacterium ginsenosidimutans]